MIDYMIMEAVYVKVRKEDEKAAREQARKEFKRDIDHLKQYQ